MTPKNILSSFAVCVILGSATSTIPSLRAQDTQTQIKQLQDELSALRGTFISFKEAQIKLEEELSAIPPVGSIMAYSGPLAGLAQMPKWLPCDGRIVSGDQYPELWDRIRTTWGGTGKPSFRLPDLQGLFLRGVDGSNMNRDPDAAAKTRDPNGNGERNTVGTIEKDSTRLPNNPLTAVGGSHSHDLGLELTATRVPGATVPISNRLHTLPTVANTVANPWIATSPKKSLGGGEHSHNLAGGDAETRPKNAAVFWIIRVQ